MSASDGMVRAAAAPLLTDGWVAEVDAEGEPRVRDVDLAERAGMAQPRNIRAIIRANLDELQEHGRIVERTRRVRSGSLGNLGPQERDVAEVWLNESQACALVMLLRTSKARDLRVAVVRAFMAARSIDAGAPGAQLMARLLRFQAAKSSRKLWGEEIVASLCQTYGIARAGNALPAPLLGVIGWIYRTVLTKDAYAELKARNPGGSARDLHYQWWTDELRGLIKRRMRAHYKRDALQLSIDTTGTKPARRRK